MNQKPVKFFFTTFFVIILGYAVTAILSFSVDLNGKYAFTHIPENPLVLKGQEIYYQEGCQYCHTLNVRASSAEIKRYIDPEIYGFDPSIEPNEFLFFAPFPVGEVRIGPDLSTIASKYTREQLEELLIGKSEKASFKKYHQYGYLFINEDLQPLFLSWKIRWLMNTGLPIGDPYHRSVFLMLDEKTKGDALVEFLSYLGKRKMEFQGKFYR